MMNNLDVLLRLAVNKDASDVHLKAGIVPVIRRHGNLRLLDDNFPTMTGHSIQELAFKIMNEEQKELFLKDKEVDIGYGVAGLGRFRINVFRQRGTVRMVVRIISDDVPTMKSLQLPSVIEKVADIERGLVLVTGATGSGKSSTMAAMIDYINHKKSRHIVTIEDPIEFLIRDKKSIITQRELGVDTNNFLQAIRSALRQDPDVILIGEMRDQETIETALVAAETGHLVISTMHTLDAQESIHRILSVFDGERQQQIRLQLSSVLRAIVSQRLAQKADKSGFVPVVEVLINNTRVRDMIEKPERTKEIIKAIEEGQSTYGMQSFDQSLMKLLEQEEITYAEALRLTDKAEDFNIYYQGVTREGQNSKNRPAPSETEIKESWSHLPDVEVDKSDRVVQNKKQKKKKRRIF